MHTKQTDTQNTDTVTQSDSHRHTDTYTQTHRHKQTHAHKYMQTYAETHTRLFSFHKHKNTHKPKAPLPFMKVGRVATRAKMYFAAVQLRLKQNHHRQETKSRRPRFCTPWGLRPIYKPLSRRAGRSEECRG